jgi:hypothetical protein
MAQVMLALGEFKFSVDEVSYQELEKRHSWRWLTYQRVNQKSASQYQGPGSSEISLNGLIYAETAADVQQLAKIKAEGDKGTALRLISGSAAMGRDWGLWCMLELTEKGSLHLPDGTPLKIEFSIRLKEYGDDNR